MKSVKIEDIAKGVYFMSKKEGKHYEKRNSKSKETYSVRSLVEEITGISPNEQAFDAAYKEVQRIIGVFQGLDGVTEGTIKVPKDQKNGFIKATKAFYEDEKYRDMLAQIRKGEVLTLEQHDMLIDLFLESLLDGKSEEEKNKIRQVVSARKEEEFFELAKEMRRIVLEDIDLIDEVQDYQAKLQCIQQYKEILEQALGEWRQAVQIYICLQRLHETALAKNPHLQTKEPLSPDNLTPEILTELTKKLLFNNEENELQS